MQFHWTAWPDIPDDSSVHNHCYNLRSHSINVIILFYASTAWHVRLKQYYPDSESSADVKQLSRIITAQHHYKEKRNLEKACETPKKDIKDENQRCDRPKRDERKEKDKDKRRLEERKDENKYSKEHKEGDRSRGEGKSKKRDLDDTDGEGREKKRVRILEGKLNSREGEMDHKKYEENACKRKEKDELGKKKDPKMKSEFEEEKRKVEGEEKTDVSGVELKDMDSLGKKTEETRVKVENELQEHKLKSRGKDEKRVKIPSCEAEHKEKIKEHPDSSDKHKKEHKRDREKRHEKTPRKDNSCSPNVKKITSASKRKDGGSSDDNRSCSTTLRQGISQVESSDVLSPPSAPVDESGNYDRSGDSVYSALKKESAVCDLSQRLSSSSCTKKEVCLEGNKQPSILPAKKDYVVVVKNEPALKADTSRCHSPSETQTSVNLIDQIIASMDTSTAKVREERDDLG